MPAPTSSALQVLHTHSTMSLLDGASRVEEYLKHCKNTGLTGCGITDHGFVMGLHELLTKAKAKGKDGSLKYEGVKPIPGCEFYLKPANDHQFIGDPYPYFHLTLWAANFTGYKNLIALASRGWDLGRPHTMPYGRVVPRITFEDLAELQEGIICGSGCIEGPLGKPILRGETSDAFKNAGRLVATFRDRLFFELMPHAVDRDYQRKEIVEVHLEGDYTLRFHPDDILTTEFGELTASEAVSRHAMELVRARPLRTQQEVLRAELAHLGLSEVGAAFDGGPLIGCPVSNARIIPGTWQRLEGQFLGNECTAHRPTGCMQRLVNQWVSWIGRQLGGKFLMTLDAHFVAPGDKTVQDILLQNGNKDGWRFYTNYYQMNTQQAWEAWQRNHSVLPESERLFVEGVENNQAVVDLVEEFTVPKAYHLPDVELPIEISSRDDLDHNARLLAFTLQRIREHGRFPTDPERVRIYSERLAKELKVIAENPSINFLPYFLILDVDVCSYARSIGELVGPGRGSAAGCLLAYLLKITHIDPIRWGLSFERFLSLGRIARGKFPDIDLDFGDPKKIIEYLAGKYGDRFARICTTGTVKLKGAIRDVSRIMLGTQHDKAMADEVNATCVTIENTPQGMDVKKWLHGYTDDDSNYHAGHLELNPVLQSFLERYPQIREMVDRLLDVPRSIGRHASAYCISDVGLHEIVPMCRVNNEVCTQFTMNPVEALGLIKMDFLGLNTLKDISGALKLIRGRHNIDIDIYDMMDAAPSEPQIDPVTRTVRTGVLITDERSFRKFHTGATETVFQFKTAIATPLCRDVRPRSLLDLANITANGRPGTMEALLEDGKTTLIQAWVQRRKGQAPVSFLHPDLEEILEPTQGIFTYQEQIMAAFMKSCGYSEEKADEIREIVGKKKKEQMEKIIPDIRERLANRGWNQSQIESFISLCVAASSYSFNKSHSVAYAYIGYVCQWLKSNYPLEWWASVLNNSNNDDLRDAARHVKDFVSSPDINQSDLDFYIIDEGLGKLVFPLNRVKGVGKGGASIKANVPYLSLEDFYERVDRRTVNKRVVYALIFAGAFDALCGVTTVLGRNQIYRNYLTLRKVKTDEYTDQDEAELLKKQQELLAIGQADFVELLMRKTGEKIIYPAELPKFQDDQKVRVGGVAVRVKHTKSKKKQEPMGFIDLENQSEVVNVTVFPSDYQKLKSFMKEGKVLVIEGAVNRYQGKVSVIAERILELQDENPEENDDDGEVERDFPDHVITDVASVHMDTSRF